MQTENKFGPWATMFDTGPHARLSTFWKRRMAMLPSTASAEKKISVRVGFAVLLAACAALSAPTVYLLRAPQAKAVEPQAPAQAEATLPPLADPTFDTDADANSRDELTFEPGTVVEESELEPRVDEIIEAPLLPDGNQPGPREELSNLDEAAREPVEVAPVEVKSVERRVHPAGQPVPVTAVAVALPTKRVEFLPAPSADEEKILKALQGPTAVEFSDTPLPDAIDFLKTQHQIEIELDERGITQEGVDRNTLINLSSKGVPLRSTLRRMLSSLNLTFYVEDDVLLITGKEAADETLVTRTYPVGDMVSNTAPAAAVQPARPIEPPSDEAIAKAGGMGGGGAKRAASRPPEGYARLVEAITNTIIPASWDDLGGNGAIVVVPESSSLVISQTHAAHDDVVRLLRSLRAARAIAQQSSRPTGAVSYGAAGAVTYGVSIPAMGAPTYIPTAAPPIYAPAATPARSATQEAPAAREPVPARAAPPIPEAGRAPRAAPGAAKESPVGPNPFDPAPGPAAAAPRY